MIKAVEINVSGIVQGVGYRPFIYLAAVKCRLCGYVTNKGGEVFIHAEGDLANVDTFLSYITNNYPEGACVQSVIKTEGQVKGFKIFEICESMQEVETMGGIPSDAGICEACLKDISNPDSRYYLYPFTSCTKCGPRLTIIERFPYDRDNTSMKEFEMCCECRKEYSDPNNRRYNAQTICCPNCGPTNKLIDKNGIEIKGDIFQKARLMIKQGNILAVKGIGGYHLICDAQNDKAVTKLRQNKKRSYKPFAVMFRDLDTINKYCDISKLEKELLLNREKPIIILNQKKVSGLANMINPGLNKLGAILPYSGIHHLLFDGEIQAVVATSGNISGLPLITEDKEAIEYLGYTADAFITHNRKILTPCDDSVIRTVCGNSQLIRRSRGYAPIPIILKNDNTSESNTQSILACGADLKNTFCMLKNGNYYISQHMGDIDKFETLQVYKETIKKYNDILNLNPKLIACDMHPDYASAKFAQKSNIPIVKIQHHHAHIASVLAENHFDGDVIGIAFDGTGYGDDGTIWGGEFFTASLKGYKRVGHLRQVPMPGGEMAVKEPWRMTGAYLRDAFDKEHLSLGIDCLKELMKRDWGVLKNSLNEGYNAVITSSAGRLFDAVSGILGICFDNDYEGQASSELEAAADKSAVNIYEYEIQKSKKIIIDFRKTIRGIVQDLNSNTGIKRISGRFHNTVAQAILEVCILIRNTENLNTAALSGGVFQNQLLLEKTVKKLRSEGFKVLLNSMVPCNDGGISLGQAAIAKNQC